LSTYRTAAGDRIAAEVTWSPYQLRPNMPVGGIPKAPDTPDNPRVGARMKAGGLAVGIDFTGKTDRYPNTLDAHVLLDYVLEQNGSTKQNEVQERLFKAYFTDGIFPDKEHLSRLAAECGLDGNKAKEALEDDGRRYKVKGIIAENSKRVTGGVPYFIVNGRPVFSGARGPEAFHEVFNMLL